MKKCLRFCYVFILTVVMLTGAAYAYLDPSVMTYAIQAVAGVLIAVGAVVGIYWRRAKNKINEKLHIDENSKKEVEDDVIELDNSDNDKNNQV